MTPVVPLAALAHCVEAALAEDLGNTGDITTRAVVPAGTRMSAVIRSREAGCIAGTDAIAAVLSRLPESATARILVADGRPVNAGDAVAELSGAAATLLTGERTILNLLGRLSGIATATAAVVRAVEGTGVAIKDTRKTTPGLRLLEKYAVAVGGGVNHRIGLHDAVLIKDNHIGIAGSITEAIARTRAALGASVAIQVEVETLAELEEALQARAASVLLDNMKPEQLRCAVALVSGRCYTEASGGITLANVRAIAETGVDAISLGWLTHSAKSLDLGLDLG